jgi:hypothetical protein
VAVLETTIEKTSNNTAAIMPLLSADNDDEEKTEISNEEALYTPPTSLESISTHLSLF